jgi:hypothetical protein
MEFWIKSVGAARAPLDDEWLRETTADGRVVESQRLVERVHFPRNKRPVGIDVGDYFLLYGVTARGGRIVGAGIFKSTFYEDDDERRREQDAHDWPWRIDVEMLLSLWHAHRGPTIDAIDIPGPTMRRRSHLRLTEEQYITGVDALAAVAHPGRSGH